MRPLWTYLPFGISAGALWEWSVGSGVFFGVWMTACWIGGDYWQQRKRMREAAE